MNTQPSSPRTQYFFLALILLAYCVVAAFFAVYTPPWQAPDEPAHYNYAAQVAADGCCPVIETGDWDSAYLDELKAARFAPGLLDNLDSVQYEDHQPPLYYLLQSLVYKISNGSLTAMRLFSALLGLGVVLCAYQIAILLVPSRPQVALGAAALTGLLPQHVAILASVNNDSLSGLVIGLTLIGIMLYLKNPPDADRKLPLLLGLLVGLGLLTKLSTLFLAGLVPIAILLKWWGTKQAKTGLITLLRPLISFALPVVALGSIWWLHNINVYGFPDLFGQHQHNLVVADQARTADFVANIGFGQYLQTAIQTTFNSFWGQFGWMALPLPSWMYPVFLVLLFAGVSGLIVNGVRNEPSADKNEASVWRRNSWSILGLTVVFAVLAYIYYNLEFLQLQGRYLFSGIVPFAIGLALGVDAWIRLLFRRVPGSRWLTVLVFLALAPLDLYLLFRVIEPLLKP